MNHNGFNDGEHTPETKTDNIDELRDILREEMNRYLLRSGEYEQGNAITFEFGDDESRSVSLTRRITDPRNRLVRQSINIGLPVVMRYEHVPGDFVEEIVTKDVMIALDSDSRPGVVLPFDEDGESLQEDIRKSALDLLSSGEVIDETLAGILRNILNIDAPGEGLKHTVMITDKEWERILEATNLIMDSYNVPLLISGHGIQNIDGKIFHFSMFDTVAKDLTPLREEKTKSMLMVDVPSPVGTLTYFSDFNDSQINERISIEPPYDLPELSDEDRKRHSYAVIRSDSIHDEPEVWGDNVPNIPAGDFAVRESNGGGMLSTTYFKTHDEAQVWADRRYKEDIWQSQQTGEVTPDHLRQLAGAVRRMNVALEQQQFDELLGGHQ